MSAYQVPAHCAFVDVLHEMTLSNVRRRDGDLGRSNLVNQSDASQNGEDKLTKYRAAEHVEDEAIASGVAA